MNYIQTNIKGKENKHLIVSELLYMLESSRVKADIFLAKSYSLWFSGSVSSHALTPMTNKEGKKIIMGFLQPTNSTKLLNHKHLGYTVIQYQHCNTVSIRNKFIILQVAIIHQSYAVPRH